MAEPVNTVTAPAVDAATASEVGPRSVAFSPLVSGAWASVFGVLTMFEVGPVVVVSSIGAEVVGVASAAAVSLVCSLMDHTPVVVGSGSETPECVRTFSGRTQTWISSL
jgi:hypothetical protein